MVFPLPPPAIFKLLGVSQVGMILNSTKSNADPTQWKRMQLLLGGRIAKPTHKHFSWFLGVLKERSPDAADFLESIWHAAQAGETLPGFFSCFSGGYAWATGIRLVTLEHEERAMEELRSRFFVAAESSNFETALDLLRSWALYPKLPLAQQIVGRADVKEAGAHGEDALKDFGRRLSPLVIVASLYVLACAEADLMDERKPSPVIPLLPVGMERETDILALLPSQRWLKRIRDQKALKGPADLHRFLLDRNAKIPSREFRTWWEKGVIPPWSRVRQMVRNISAMTGGDPIQIRNEIETTLFVIRLLDGLLRGSVAIRDHCVPDYDPLDPFRTYPTLLEHARVRKTALSVERPGA